MQDEVVSCPQLNKQLLAQFSSGILQCQGADDARPLVISLLNSLCQQLSLELHPDQYKDEDFTLTPCGKAVSPTTAAQCAEDIERSRVFIQAIYTAVQERLTSKRPIQVLYAGTGPLGWLILPLLSVFNAQQLQVTALDIHPFSLDSFRSLCKTLDLEDRITAWVCADAFVGPGRRVGEGAIVGAAAVVVSDVSHWEIVAGNPARIIKRRVLRIQEQEERS